MSIHSAGSMLPSMSSSEPVFRQNTSSTNECISQHGHGDQEPLVSVAQTFLDRLRHDFHGMRDDTYIRIIHICLERILANYQPEVVNESTYSNIRDQLISRTPATFNDGSYRPSTNFPVLLQPSEVQRLQAELPSQEYNMLSRSVTGVPPNGMGLPFDHMLLGRIV